MRPATVEPAVFFGRPALLNLFAAEVVIAVARNWYAERRLAKSRCRTTLANVCRQAGRQANPPRTGAINVL